MNEEQIDELASHIEAMVSAKNEVQSCEAFLHDARCAYDDALVKQARATDAYNAFVDAHADELPQLHRKAPDAA